MSAWVRLSDVCALHADDPWMDAWQSTWRQHVSTQGLGTLAVVFSALSRLGTNQGPGTLVPDAYDASFIDTLRRLDQCLHAPDAASTLTAPDLALWFTTLCSFELGPPPNPVSEAGIDQAELTLRCLALLPGALQAELDVSAPGAPSALGRPKLEAEFLGALAVATMSDDGLEVGSLAHAARGVWVALEAWYTRHAPVAVTLMLLSYLDFSQQVEHRVGVGLLEAVVAQLVARGLKQERKHELDSMLRGNAYWYEVSVIGVTCACAKLNSGKATFVRLCSHTVGIRKACSMHGLACRQHQLLYSTHCSRLCRQSVCLLCSQESYLFSQQGLATNMCVHVSGTCVHLAGLRGVWAVPDVCRAAASAVPRSLEECSRKQAKGDRGIRQPSHAPPHFNRHHTCRVRTRLTSQPPMAASCVQYGYSRASARSIPG